MARNFRSRKEVLEGTNFLFKQIMGVKVGEILYDEAAELRPGATYPENEPYPIKLMLIDKNDDSKELLSEEIEGEMATGNADEFNVGDLENSQLEARVIAAQIKALIAEGKQVYNSKTKTYRPIMYRDMVILLRSMTWAPQLMEEFKLQGIPTYANLSTGYFEATEVAVMMSLLRVIDNPFQDISLASVLRSPIVGLNEEELAKIRLRNKGTFWDAVKTYCRNQPVEGTEEVYEKVRNFYGYLAEWRSLARQGSLSDLIWQIYRDTQFYDFVGGMPGGKQRQANLRALYDRARQYEQTSFRGLFRFLRFVERMMDRGDDLGAARALGEQEDVVRIMTIHSSKGLEFPVVFIAGLSRTFNMTDIRNPYMLDKDYGFAAKYVNAEKRISYPSLPQIAFKQKKKMEMLAEEMRVLYVALTRAKEKLYLIGTLKDAGKMLEQWHEALSNSDWLLSDYDRASAASFIDWIGPAIIRHQDCEGLWKAKAPSILVPSEINCHSSSWEVSILSGVEIEKQQLVQEMEKDPFMERVENNASVPIKSFYFDEIQSRLTWEYSFGDAAKHRSKQSVSEMKRQREISDEHSGTELVTKYNKSIMKRPKFMQEKALSPAERGTALHMVMQHVELQNPISLDTLTEQINSMIHNELLTAEQAEAVDLDLIENFFLSDLGRRLRTANMVNREVPFTLSVPASEVYPSWQGEHESVFVQGIIDCVFEDENGLILIDFKSDRITGRYKGGFEEARTILKDRYMLQMSLYTRALEQIWKKKVSERYLVFFDGSHVLDLDQ
ncbi:helicase-exonuclease AddAB subunit AddA [Bacillus sp. MRMR6]|nr:helicase-exonuclease AddAB subunit AddA [Bacillus sp. MRMR6]